MPQGEQVGYHFPNNYRPPIQSLTAGPGGFEGTVKHSTYIISINEPFMFPKNLFLAQIS